MEIMIPSPVNGVCVKTLVKEGAVVDAHDTLAVIRQAQEKNLAATDFVS